MSERQMQDDTKRLIERERQKFEDVNGFLDANGEASARSRNLIVALIVASVLTAVGVLNSLQDSWMSRRIDLLRRCDSDYLKKYVGECPTLDSGASIDEAKKYVTDLDLYQRRYLAFMSSASTALVENRYFVHVPFFGLSFDVNDLGILAGVGLFSILLLLRFSAGTELENLKLSFRETNRLGCFREFYRLAAMRQVLTMPQLPERKIRSLEKWLAKPVYFIPAGVYLWVLVHDLDTYRLGTSMDPARMRILTICEILFFLAIAYLGCGCFRRSIELDLTWDRWWSVYNGHEPPSARHAESVVPLLNPQGQKESAPSADDTAEHIHST